MMRFLLFLLPVLALSIEIPQSSQYDKRIAFAKYNADNVVKINAKAGYVSVIEFAKEEIILNMAIGFIDGWELSDKGNLLFVTPKAVEVAAEQENQDSKVTIEPNPAEWKTNLIVSTNLSMYVFELNIDNEKNVFKLSFFYPQKEIDRLNKIKTIIEEEAKNDNIETALNRVSVPKNWDFYQKVMPGSDDIKPNFAYDDGTFTYLGFDNTKTFPSAFELIGNKEEVLNTHIKKDGDYDVLVIHKIAAKIVLRSGDKVVGVLNKSYAKNPPKKTRQTSNDEAVERVLKNDQ